MLGKGVVSHIPSNVVSSLLILPLVSTVEVVSLVVIEQLLLLEHLQLHLVFLLNLLNLLHGLPLDVLQRLLVLVLVHLSSLLDLPLFSSVRFVSSRLFVIVAGL